VTRSRDLDRDLEERLTRLEDAVEDHEDDFIIVISNCNYDGHPFHRQVSNRTTGESETHYFDPETGERVDSAAYFHRKYGDSDRDDGDDDVAGGAP